MHPKLTNEQKRIKIAEAVGLKTLTEQEKKKMELKVQGYSRRKPQHLAEAWVCTHKFNPKGVWLMGECSQAVDDKSIADKWRAEKPRPEDYLVVEVDVLLDVPDYFNDLNVMHEAENVLNDMQHSNYRGKLLEVCLSLADALCATAAQRAEAFGLALGLWKEGE